MPQIFKVGSYLIYFWLNEGKPLEPIHVHVSERIPSRKLRDIMDIIEARYKDIESKWLSDFGELRYYC